MAKHRGLALKEHRTKTQIRKEKKKQKRQYQLKSSTGKVWQRELTPKFNYARVGLTANPNMAEKEVQEIKETLPVEQEPQKLEEIKSNKQQFKSKLCYIVHESERKTLQTLIDTYGDDYKAMAWDTERNYLQWTPKQLEKKIAKYRKYLEQLEFESKTKTGVKGPVQPKKRYKHALREGDRYPYHKETDVFF
ncbi:hypothetical protein FDP41_008465 [Naegleria fowleri]|uniref:Nucleolar protein 16 n=1 Tax=Naegleria fowleri TaxID=5763 RepID=A0A6A5BGV1_NAEFO|nr:uncharacterized protein FDP41_008465 [Naegleria fowleri]KAF0973258.1 hypothetical protein FDP41_008465 [Naegleria fowleri]CAG4711945.1 unnamed protein product [Naegleria fowleri]